MEKTADSPFDWSPEGIETARRWQVITGAEGRPLGTAYGAPVYEVDELPGGEPA